MLTLTYYAFRKSIGVFKLSQECCYDRSGSLIVGGCSAGSADAQPPHEWENHFKFDLDPFISCCSGPRASVTGMNHYFQRRPSDNCSTFQPLDPPG